MRTNFYVFLLLFMTGISTLSAQNLKWVYEGKELSENAVVTISDYNEVMGQMEAALGIKNNGTVNETFKIRKEERSMGSGSAMLMCVGDLCYPASQQITGDITIAAGGTDNSFHANLSLSDDSDPLYSEISFSILVGGEVQAKVTVHYIYYGANSGNFKRRVVFEEGTGTWCIHCPRGIVGMAAMKEKYPDNFIGIAVHAGDDPMDLPTYSAGLGFSALPNGVFNRNGVLIDPNFEEIESNFLKEIKIAAKASIEVEAKTISDSEVEVSIASQFAQNYSDANFKYAIVVIEHNVNVNSTRYNQANNYAGKDEAMGGFEKLPNPVPGSQMFYQDVARSISSGFSGIANSVPTDITAFENITFSRSIVLPSSIINKANIEIVALLLDGTDGSIVNAAKTEVEQGTVSNEQISDPEIKVEVYDQSIHITSVSGNASSLLVQLYRVSGAMTAHIQQAGGHVIIPVTTGPGIYFVRITEGSKIYVRKVVIL